MSQTDPEDGVTLQRQDVLYHEDYGAAVSKPSYPSGTLRLEWFTGPRAGQRTKRDDRDDIAQAVADADSKWSRISEKDDHTHRTRRLLEVFLTNVRPGDTYDAGDTLDLPDDDTYVPRAIAHRWCDHQGVLTPVGAAIASYYGQLVDEFGPDAVKEVLDKGVPEFIDRATGFTDPIAFERLRDTLNNEVSVPRSKFRLNDWPDDEIHIHFQKGDEDDVKRLRRELQREYGYDAHHAEDKRFKDGVSPRKLVVPFK